MLHSTSISYSKEVKVKPAHGSPKNVQLKTMLMRGRMDEACNHNHYHMHIKDTEVILFIFAFC